MSSFPSAGSWLCRRRCRKVHSVQKERVWRDLSMRKLPLQLRYRPRRVECPRCGVRVEDFPWAEPWARVTTSLSNAVARLTRELSWQGTARQYGLNWKSVATIVKRAVQYGLKHRTRPPVGRVDRMRNTIRVVLRAAAPQIHICLDV